MNWFFEFFYGLFKAEAKAEQDRVERDERAKDASRKAIREELEAAERRRLEGK